MKGLKILSENSSVAGQPCYVSKQFMVSFMGLYVGSRFLGLKSTKKFRTSNFHANSAPFIKDKIF